MPSALDGLRVATSLRDCAVDVVYRVGPAGCGVEELVLNGAPLTFTRGSNPHRLGAARVPTSVLLERLAKGRNALEITLG
jgi:CRISPR-associated protein Csx3